LIELKGEMTTKRRRKVNKSEDILELINTDICGHPITLATLPLLMVVPIWFR